MTGVGSESQPLRVAIVGAGAAGFYTASQLLRGGRELNLEIDLFDKLPTPYGLVRSGVAPDHQKDKSVTKVFDAAGINPAVRYFGGLSLGEDFSIDELRSRYHQIVITTGAGSSRALGIPGEDLYGVYSATDFVGWYNAHPAYQNCTFNLHSKAAAIVGIGNVSIDVARVLAKTNADLAATDIATHALDALNSSGVRDIYLIGRRGPAQAAFTPEEIKDLSAVDGVRMVVSSDEAELDSLSQQWLDTKGDKKARANVRLIQDFARQSASDQTNATARVRIHLRFWLSPLELQAEDGKLARMVLARCRPEMRNDSIGATKTDETVNIETGMLFCSVGYRATPLPQIPFDQGKSVIPNDQGRILNGESSLVGLYTAGWIKRGPTGVIGTNKTCAKETVGCMLEDIAAAKLLQPEQPSQDTAWLLAKNNANWIDYTGWQAVDAAEVQNGEAKGKIREKFLSISNMLAVGRSD